MNKFISISVMILSTFLFQKSYGATSLQYPYLEHNILQAVLGERSDKCFTIEPVQKTQDNIFSQNISTSPSCSNEKNALISLLSQSKIIFTSQSNYQILVDNVSLPSPDILSKGKELSQIRLLFKNTPYFIDAKSYNIIMHPDIMLYFKPTIVSYVSDDISQNKNLTYLTTAEIFNQIFDFENSNMWISNTISQ